MKTADIKKEFDQLVESFSTEEKDEQAAKLLMFRFLSIVEAKMEERGMSRKELAQELGTSASYITQLFRGHKLANMTILAKMQRVLDISFHIDSGKDLTSRHNLGDLQMGDGKGVWVYRPFSRDYQSNIKRPKPTNSAEKVA